MSTNPRPIRSDLAQAILASEEMDIAAEYVAAGRRYGGLSDAVLERIWASACLGYFLRGQHDRWNDCLHAAGELTLRGLRPPMRLIPAKDRKRIAVRVGKIARRPEVMRELQTHIQDFLRQSAARRN